MIAPLATVLSLAALASGPDSVPLFDNLGTHHHPVTTRVPKTQAYFDQGLRLTYAFNHTEAIRAFQEAARLDPDCAMCWWGVALAYGPNINLSMDSSAGVAAWKAVQNALALSPKANPSERAYIRALATRYAAVPPADRASLDSAYARTMRDVARRYPRDFDAATLYAEALMDLRPWSYWKKDGTPYPGTTAIVATLERVVKANPDHPGACHFYIHAMEAADAAKAVPCAERLARLMPGAGHMVHMPSHIYIRVGRWADAIQANVHAVHSDESYAEGQHPEGAYPLLYVPHNYHFMAFAATMAGHSKQAIEAARETAAHTSPDVVRAIPALESYLTYPFLALTTFGHWDEVLALPLPPADLRYSTAIATYARGIALAATGRWGEAQAALDTVAAIAATAGVDIKPVTEIAEHALRGELAIRRGQYTEAVTHFKAAEALQDGLTYNEPPTWYYPIRHSLGAALLMVGRPAEAERAYREDLTLYPENGWSLYGLAEALRAQGRTAEVHSVAARFRHAWEGADVTLVASRF